MEVWKVRYPLGLVRGWDKNLIELPKGSQILTAREQGNDFCMWFLCSPKQIEKEQRRIVVVGTGHKLDYLLNDLRYIGTGSFEGGNLILHMFEVRGITAS